MSIAHDKMCSFIETSGVPESLDPIKADWHQASEVKNGLSCLWHFLHVLFMKSVFPRNICSYDPSLPSHLAPIDRCCIMYTSSACPIYPLRPSRLLGICSKEWCLSSETPGSETSSWYVFNHFQMYPFRVGWRSTEETCMRMSYLLGRAVPTDVSTKILGVPPGICGITCPFCTFPEVEEKTVAWLS